MTQCSDIFIYYPNSGQKFCLMNPTIFACSSIAVVCFLFTSCCYACERYYMCMDYGSGSLYMYTLVYKKWNWCHWEQRDWQELKAVCNILLLLWWVLTLLHFLNEFLVIIYKTDLTFPAWNICYMDFLHKYHSQLCACFGTALFFIIFSPVI